MANKLLYASFAGAVKRIQFFTIIVVFSIGSSRGSDLATPAGTSGGVGGAASAVESGDGVRGVEPQPSTRVDSSLDGREVFLRLKDSHVYLTEHPIYPRGQFLELQVPSENSLVTDGVRECLLFKRRKLKDELLELERDVYSWAEALRETEGELMSRGASGGAGAPTRPESYGAASAEAPLYPERHLDVETQLESLRSVICEVARFQSRGETLWSDRLRELSSEKSGLVDRVPPAFVMSYEEPFYRLVHRKLGLPVVSDSVVFPGEEKARNVLVINQDRSSSRDGLFELKRVGECFYQFVHRGLSLPVASDAIVFPGETEARRVLVAREFIPEEDVGASFFLDVFPEKELRELDVIEDDVLGLLKGLVGRITDLKEREREMLRSAFDGQKVFLRLKDSYVSLTENPVYPRSQFLELQVPSKSSRVTDSVRERLLFERGKLKDELLELERDVYSWAEALRKTEGELMSRGGASGGAGAPTRPESYAAASASYAPPAVGALPYRERPVDLKTQLETLRGVISGVARFQSRGETLWSDRLRELSSEKSGLVDRVPSAFVMSYEEPFYRLVHRKLGLPVVSDSVVFPGEEKARNVLVINQDRSSSRDGLFELKIAGKSFYQFVHGGLSLPVASDTVVFPREREARRVLVAREFIPEEDLGASFSLDVFPERELRELDMVEDDLIGLVGGLVGRIADLKERERAIEMLRRERVLSEEGGRLLAGDVLMTVPTGAVIEPESFSIKPASDSSAFSALPEFVSPLTSVYEMTPHRRDPASYRSNPYEGRSFNDWVDLAFPVSPSQGPVALFIQKDDPQDRELKKWLVVDPDSVEGERANFKVKSFSFCFLGNMDVGRELPPCFDYCYDPLPDGYRAYKAVRPGLNYRVCCENNECNPHRDDFVIINKGFGDSRPNEDIGDEKLSCPKCGTVVHEFDSLKQLILFQAKGTIKYKRGRNPAQEKTFEAFDSKLVLFGDSEIEETYSTFFINVEKQLSNLNLKTKAAFLDVDPHGNPRNSIFDLGADGAFRGFKVLVGKFYGREGFTKESFDAHAGKALKEKGFGCYCTEDEDDFLEKLPTCHVAWVIGAVKIKNERFVGAVKSFYESGKGLMLWEDNDSQRGTHTVEVLRSLFSGMVVEGNDPGKKLMRAAANCSKPQTFRKMHPVLRGIERLYEGVTISHPSPAIPPFPVKVLATSSSNHPNIMYVDEENRREEGRHGRVIIDCGFTKLFENLWDSAGTARYVKNAACWLTGLPDPD